MHNPFTLDENQAKYQIRACRPGHIRVNDRVYTKSLIVSPDALIDDWEPQQISELLPQHFVHIIKLNPAILLIGTGNTLVFPDLCVYGDLINQGIGVEIMNTHAACLTYNALTAENRKVVAALIIR